MIYSSEDFPESVVQPAALSKVGMKLLDLDREGEVLVFFRSLKNP